MNNSKCSFSVYFMKLTEHKIFSLHLLFIFKTKNKNIFIFYLLNLLPIDFLSAEGLSSFHLWGSARATARLRGAQSHISGPRGASFGPDSDLWHFRPSLSI